MKNQYRGALLGCCLALSSCGGGEATQSSSLGAAPVSSLSLTPTATSSQPLLMHTNTAGESRIRDVNGEVKVFVEDDDLSMNVQCSMTTPSPKEGNAESAQAFIDADCQDWRVDLAAYGGQSLTLRITQSEGSLRTQILKEKTINVHSNTPPKSTLPKEVISSADQVVLTEQKKAEMIAAFSNALNDGEQDQVAKVDHEIVLTPKTGWDVAGQRYSRGDGSSGSVAMRIRAQDAYGATGDWQVVYEQWVNRSGQAIGPNDITDVVLLTGQSNALAAYTHQGYNASLDASHPHVFAYTDQGWKVASLDQSWFKGWPRGGADKPSNNLLLHFAKQVVATDSQRVIGVILTAAPGKAIAHWDKGAGYYEQVASKTRQALDSLPQKSQLDGMLWHQGETDWSDNPTYLTKLNNYIANVRNESWFGYDRPFICGETIDSPVNNQLGKLNTDGDPWTGCAGGEGLPSRDKNVHFSTEGIRALGKMYGDKYLEMVN